MKFIHSDIKSEVLYKGVVGLESNLPMIRKDNLLNKVVNFFKIKLFMRKNKYEEKVTYDKETNKDKYLLDIQRRFESGELKEEDINMEDTYDLKKLYEQQIIWLNGEIKLVEAEMIAK